MRRSRIGLLLSAVILVVVGSLPGVAMADPTPSDQTSQQEMLAGVLHGEGIVQTKKARSGSRCRTAPRQRRRTRR